MYPNGNNSEVPTPPSRQRSSWPLIIIAALFIIVPFLTWYLTWFGRALSDEDVVTYLADEKNPRHLQHVRFGDASGRPELRAMLEPFEVKSPLSGTIVSLLTKGSKVRAGGLLARIRDASGTVQEFRSPMDGAIEKVSVKEAATVTAGQPIFSLTPDRATVSDALRALAYVGTKDDLPIIDAYANNAANEAGLKQAAVEAVKAIRARSGA